MSQTQTSNLSPPRPNGRLMLCNIGRVGDTILRNSILDSAFRTYETVDYICGPKNADLIRSDLRINRVTVLRNSVAGFADLARAALRQRYDGFIELKDHWSWTSTIVARLFRSRMKTGCNADRLQPYDRDARSVTVFKEHKLETIRRVGELAGLTQGEYKPTLALSPDSTRWFDENYKWLPPFIFLNISATAEHRVWPTMHWAKYVRGCGLDKETILVNGVSKDRGLVTRLCAELPGAVAFKPRQFMDVAAALNRAQLVLTVDTGIVHACSALNRPIVALTHSGNDYRPLSTRKLVITPPNCTVSQMDADLAISLTLQHGLP